MFQTTIRSSKSRLASILIASSVGLCAAHAQTAPCGLTSITESTAPVYPPIARIAHLNGAVILMVRFNLDGTVQTIHDLSGNPMLALAATNFVKSWQANPYKGPRECPIVIKFELTAGTCAATLSDPVAPLSRIDLQHVIVRAKATIICDPPMYTTRKRKRFNIF